MKESTRTIIRMEMGTPKSPMTLRSCKQIKEPVVPIFLLPPAFLPILHLPRILLIWRGPSRTNSYLYSSYLCLPSSSGPFPPVSTLLPLPRTVYPWFPAGSWCWVEMGLHATWSLEVETWGRRGVEGTGEARVSEGKGRGVLTLPGK